MGGKKTTMKIVICSLVTLFYVIASTFVIYLVVLQNAYPGYNAFTLFFENFGSNAEFTSGVVGDLILGLVFGGIGIAIAASSMMSKIHRKR